jgi:hypothetical protein
MPFPFITSVVVVIMILDNQKLSTTLACTQASLYALIAIMATVFVDVIFLENYISEHLTLQSWMPENEISQNNSSKS